jgi:hypothetical protein
MAAPTRALFTLFMVCFLLHESSAQEKKCYPLHPLPGSLSQYQLRANRCEGLYVADVASESIDVVSFTLGTISFELNSETQLRVSARTASQEVHVRAVALPRRTYYRMDATIPSDSILVWPVADVLLPERLGADRVGVFAWTGTEDKKIFAPVHVVTTDLDNVARRDEPNLYIELPFDADRIKWRWAPLQQSRCSDFHKWQDATTSPVTAGWPVKIKLSGVPPGLSCLEVAATSQVSSSWQTLSTRVEMPGQ